MNILVTGAAGFIGSHLSERLMALGHTVRGVDCFTDFYTPALKELNARTLQAQGGQFWPLDLATDDLSPVVEGVELIYHAAAQPGISAITSYDTYVRNNLTATYRLLEAVKSGTSLKGFINLSTSSVYGALATENETIEPKPTSYYGVTKLAAEQLVLAYQRDKNFPACSLRLFSVYGPRERPEKLYPKLIDCMFKDTPFPLFEGSEQHLRSYTFVGDIVDGLIAAMHNFDRCIGEIFNIGTDTAITTGEGIRIVEDLIGKPANIQRKPKRAGDQLKTHANIEKARRVLNYNPTTTPREGLQQEVEWYKQYILGKINLY